MRCPGGSPVFPSSTGHLAHIIFIIYSVQGRGMEGKSHLGYVQISSPQELPRSSVSEPRGTKHQLDPRSGNCGISMGNSRSYSTAGSLDIWKMALFPLAAASTKEHHGGKMQRMWRSRNEVLRLIWTKSEPVTGADKHHDVTTGLQSLFLMRLHLDNLNPARSGGRELKHFGCGHAETQGQGWGW